MNVGKCGRAGQPIDDSIIGRMRIVCSTAKATVAHSECIIFIAFTQ